MHKSDTYKARYVLDETIYKSFIALSNDKNPLHTNEEFAIHKGFRGRVMHGNILNAFLSNFVGEVLPIKDVIIHSQQIDFKFPVYLNTVLQLHAEITEYYESVNVYEFKFYFENEGNQKVAKGKIQIGILK